MAPQSPISQLDEVEYQTDLHHSEEVYWDVHIEELAYLGIFHEGHGSHVGPLRKPEYPWLPDDEAYCYITPDLGRAGKLAALLP